jgi:hypothetical protein
VDLGGGERTGAFALGAALSWLACWLGRRRSGRAAALWLE